MASAPAASGSGERRLTPINRLVRFMYLGSDKCFFNKFEKISLGNLGSQLACVLEMGETRASLPISMISKVYSCKCLLRKEETMCALAFCARQDTLPELRQKAYDEAIVLIDNQSDLILFVKYCVELKKALTDDPQRRGVGRGLRRVITKWYEKQSTLQLAEMFGEHRKLHGWAHRDILRLVHVRPDASRGRPPGAEDVLTDREIVMRFPHFSSSLFVTHVDELEQAGEGARRLRMLNELKTNECTETAVAAITAHNVRLEQLPSHLLERAEVWEALIPTLPVRVLIEKLNTLKDLGFLNADHRLAKKYAKAIANQSKCDAESPRLCPVRLYILKKMYEKNERYHCPAKQRHYEKKKEKRTIAVNKAVSKKLDVLFDHLLTSGKPTKPTNYFIALDLRTKNASSEFSISIRFAVACSASAFFFFFFPDIPEHVLRNKFINCAEAMALLAYSILMKEKHAAVYQYTEDKNVIKSLSIPRSNFAAAEKFCNEKAVGVG